MEQIYKINHLIFNDSKSQFCLSYNNGIKTFNTDDFKEKYNLNSIGSISIGVLFHELNIVIFVGSENNEEYNNKKIAIFDLINQKLLYSTSFLNEIKGLKIISKYLIIGFQSELKIFSLEKKDTIIPITEIALPNNDSEIYEIWDKTSKEILSLTKIFLVYPYDKVLCLSSYIGNELSKDKTLDIKSPTNKIQNIFYLKQLNQMLIPDDKACYIYGINPDDGKQQLLLYRGKNPGIINSITLLNKNYLAMNNLNRTIHIFDIGNSNNNINITNMIGGLLYGSYISPCIRIPYKKIISEKEGEFYENDFMKKGAILFSEEDGIELRVIAYNGYAYKIKVNFLKKDFELLLKKKYANYNVNLNEDNINYDNDEGLYSSYNSIFDKEKKGKDKDKFVVIK